MFSKITFLKSGDQAEKNEVCLSFLEEIFTKSVHRGGVGNNDVNMNRQLTFVEWVFYDDALEFLKRCKPV